MKSQSSRIILQLPEWLESYATKWQPGGNTSERMRFVISAAEQNIQHQTGGPFAAAIFTIEGGELLALGVNLVSSLNNAILHAEIIAIMLAQQKLGHFDLGAEQFPRHELVSSSEPCAMCIGATGWSGVHKLIFGATVADAEAIGFDEGPISPTWKQELTTRGIKITAEVERERARQVLQHYKQNGGMIYNSRTQ